MPTEARHDVEDETLSRKGMRSSQRIEVGWKVIDNFERCVAFDARYKFSHLVFLIV